MDVDGKIYPLKDFKFKDDKLKKLVAYEFSGKERIDAELEAKKPKYLKYVIEKKFFEREPRSDAGHWRSYPKGLFLINQVEELYKGIALRIGAFPILNSNVFDLSHPGVKHHAEGYGDRLYKFKFENKELVLKFAACHGQFSLLSDNYIDSKDLPIKIYEFADSYRLEQKGELCFYRRRKFIMPDLHVLCRDMNEAKNYGLLLEKEIVKQASDEGCEYRAIYNVSQGFLNKEIEWLKQRVKEYGCPIILDVRENGKYYWVLNIEYCIIDALNRPVEIATWQIDIGNAEMFDIKYFENNEKKYPVIIHSAIIGSIERWLYLLFDKAVRMENIGELPMLPVWVSSEQVRILPLSEKHVSKALEIANELMKENVRVSVDDRGERLDKKVFNANQNWVPYIIVVGDRELDSNDFDVSIRSEKKKDKMSLQELIIRIKSECRGIKQLLNDLPLKLSERPSFIC